MILCAAVKFKIESTGKEVVLPCRRHYEAYDIMKKLGFKPLEGCEEIDQGFITTEGFFMDRQKAFEHAVNCGQLSWTTAHCKEEAHEEFLFSEDLY